MNAITLILTDAGLAALTNPAHTGTSALTVTHVGLSQTPAGSIEAQKTLAVLPGEFKRLTTFGGEVMTPRVIHLSVRDESVDAYQLRSFALYLSNGVLAAVVSSTDPIMEKVPATTMVQSLDLAFSRDIEAELVFGDFTFVNPPATTTRLGVVELATVEETLAGVDPARVVTVFGLGRTLLAWAQNFAARAHGHMIGDIDGLASALLGKAAIGHQHAASDITSGTFNIARIPAIAMSGITGLVDALAQKAAIFHEHAASDITSGTFNIARIPAIAMSGITGLVDALASKAAATHQHIADDIVSGVLAVGRIPALGMEKITGLAVALAGKAGLGEVVRFASVGFGIGRGLLYGDGNRVVVRTGAEGAERYFGFNEDGSFQAYNGNVHSQHGRVWDPGNFNPAAKVNKTGDILSGPLTMPELRLKASGTGNAGTYSALTSIYYGDDNYGVGFVGWRGGIGWTEVGSIDHLGRFLVNGHRVHTAETLRFAAAADVSNPAVAPTLNNQMISPAALWASARSIGTSGYVQIPGTPLIMQWGVRAATVPEGPVDTFLPVAFGGGCLFASATPRNASGVVTMDFFMQVMGRWQDRISWYVNRANGSAGNMSGFEWMAIGLATGNPDPAYYSGGGGGGGGGGEFNPEL